MVKQQYLNIAAYLVLNGSLLFAFSSVFADSPSPILSTEGPNVSMGQTVPALAVDEGEGEHKPHGAELLGVLPGSTTLDDLNASSIWKTPGHQEVVDGYDVYTYQIEDLPDMPYIQILLKNKVVEGIVVHLKEPRELVDARTSFDAAIKNVRPLTIQDEEGNFREVYPEKGFAFVLQPSEDGLSATSRVVQIVAERVRPDYFVLRAEEELNYSLGNAHEDAEHALLHDAGNAPANWILAELESTRANFGRAREYAIAAVKADKTVIQYQLTLVNILKELGEIENARRVLDIVEPECEGVSWFKGLALTLRGDLYRLQSQPDQDKAIECHQKAIDVFKPFVKDADPGTRTLAKKLTIKAHLSLARDIATKTWDEAKAKEAALAWLDSAVAIAQELKDQDHTDASPLFEVYCAAAEVGMDVPNVAKLESYFTAMDQTADALVAAKSTDTTENVRDPFMVGMVQWLAAKANSNIMLVYQAAGQYDQAISRGNKSLQLFNAAIPGRPESDDLERANLLFHLGMITQEGLKNQQGAATLFGKAVEIYLRYQGDVSVARSAMVGRQCINMSNLYWKSGNQKEAVRVALLGITFLQKSVDAGRLVKSDLYVPYTNLATMYNGMGDQKTGSRYAALAEECK